jgi:LETM1-like protein
MINPSAKGWVDKFFLEQNKNLKDSISDIETFYNNSRKSGFVFGHIVAIDAPFFIDTSNLLEDEISKLALFCNLYTIFEITTQQSNSQIFIDKVVDFYQKMNPRGENIFKKLIGSNVQSFVLEDIIEKRVGTNADALSKNFSYIVTNALLFVDVLAFEKYLKEGQIPDKYFSKIEKTIVNLVTIALRTKSIKSDYDDLLLKFFELSVRYTKFSAIDILTLEHLYFDYLDQALVRFYLLDLALLAMWSDAKLENEELYFLHQLIKKLALNETRLQESSDAVNQFVSKNKAEISYFNYSSPLKHFYEHSATVVSSLLQRNKKRLAKEIMKSKELVILLLHSTKRDLNESEKKKVKTQILDICKTIPSLTIFLLPGGSLLLPIFIKFIPTLLPSSFNENLDNE